MMSTVVQCDGIEGRKGMIGTLDRVHGKYPTKNTPDPFNTLREFTVQFHHSSG